MGVFGAAAAAGKLMGLDVAQMVNALGIAFSQAAGNRQCIVDGALTKRLQAGQAASSGVLAATLAREGFTGADNIFLGRYGFFELYQPDGYDAARLTDGLGTAFRGEELSFKPYPCGRPQHAILDAALAARAQLDLSAIPDNAQVIVEMDAATVAEQFRGAPHKRRPTQIVEAQFALPFLIATALVRGRIGIDQVADFADPAVLALAARIEGRDGTAPGVTVRLADGRTATAGVRTPLGAPQNPLSAAALEAKFTDCARHAVRPVADDAIAHAARTILHLEQVADVRDVLHPFA
jgi:2-methylcitrate dehydratase PrpD